MLFEKIENKTISIGSLMDSDVCKFTCDDFTKRILFKLNQYRKASNVSWKGFYGLILMLTEETVPTFVTLKVKIRQSLCQT